MSDLHLGKSDRIARRTGTLVPPYENIETLTRLADEIEATAPETVICLGDSFDDLDGIAALDGPCHALLTRMQAGRRWVWIEGNHDPGPVGLGGEHLSELKLGAITFRHIARPGANAEVSGHYHPKFGLPGGGAARKCFLYDARRCILPPFGAYTGGLWATDAAFDGLFEPPAFAVMTGRKAIVAPVLVPDRRGTIAS